MKANETSINEFLSANKTQFLIPVYQRNYDWTTYQCKQLLDDICDAGRSKDISAHFIGSIVFVHDDVYSSAKMKELVIIDGQQRLTTLTLIYLAIYSLARELGNLDLVSEINETYLINKFAPDEEKLKLRPTENNDKALKYLLRDDRSIEYTEYSKLIDNFLYFRDRISGEDLQDVLVGLQKLIFVEISLDRQKDNPQRIFESLNSTGLELSQADLIRNYILMGLGPREQKRIYNDYWQHIECAARDESQNKSLVSDFIRDYLTLKGNRIPNKSKVYEDFKNRFDQVDPAGLKESLQEMKTMSFYYNRLINPDNEQSSQIKESISNIKRLEINVVYPFLLNVYDDLQKGIITEEEFIQVLELVQSFTWRRFIVGLPTNSLNKIFMTLYTKVNSADYVASIQRALLEKSGGQRFPTDSEIYECLKLRDVYSTNSKNRLYFLERLENFDNPERVMIEGNPQITVEHIFPQNPDAKWKGDLSNDEFEEIQDKYLHTIGNLTLSGNNGKLGNKIFSEKRDAVDFGYKSSRLWLNQYLAGLSRWGVKEIENRTRMITERFLQLWPYPKVGIGPRLVSDEVNIFEADDPKGKKLEYAIFLDQKMDISQVAKLYQEVFRQLFEIQPETFFAEDFGVRIGLKKAPAHQDLRQAIPIAPNYFIEGNFDNVNKFDRIKHALKIFGLEDELLVKYQAPVR